PLFSKLPLGASRPAIRARIRMYTAQIFLFWRQIFLSLTLAPRSKTVVREPLISPHKLMWGDTANGPAPTRKSLAVAQLSGNIRRARELILRYFTSRIIVLRV